MVKCILQVKSGRQFAVDVALLKKSAVLRRMLKSELLEGEPTDKELDDDVLELEECVTEMCMEKLVEWLEYHKDDSEPPGATDGGEEEFTFTEEISDWDEEFLHVDDATLFGLIMTANYLEIRGLLDLTTTYVARMIANAKTPEEIRLRFNIKDDLTDADLKQIEEEAKTWLEDDEPATSGEQMGTGEASKEEPMSTEPAPSTSGYKP